MVVAAVAVLNYAVVTGAEPSIVADGPLAPERAEGWRNDPREMTIYDARRLTEGPRLDDAGFELVRWPAASRKRACCFAEAEEISRAVTGAKRAVAFDWTSRTMHPPTPDNTAVGAPVLRVHTDFTPRSALETLRHALPASGRCAIVSVWRPLSAVSAWPLAVADARTVNDGDLIVVRRRYPDATGETSFVVHRPAHRWFTFPLMKPDETIVFKLFDMAAGGARWTPHSAFGDPNTSVGTAARESVEIRVALAY